MVSQTANVTSSGGQIALVSGNDVLLQGSNEIRNTGKGGNLSITAANRFRDIGNLGLLEVGGTGSVAVTASSGSIEGEDSQ